MSRSSRIESPSLDHYRHTALQEIGSTNIECLARARAGDTGFHWITARRQTEGRGRRGRSWASQDGNLYASLLLIDPAPMDRLGSLPLAVAVAVQRAIQRVMPPGSEAVKIKWPNDILIGGRKTCGILLEGEGLGNGHHALVIGCGINVAEAPDHGLYPITSLRDEGASVSADELFAHLFQTMAEVLEIWDRGNGVAAIIDAWRDVAGGIGQPITVNLTKQSFTGRFEGIDEDGRLMLDIGTGTHKRFAAGDVFFG